MERLPENLLFEILKRFDRTADRNSFSLLCKRLYRVEAQQREFLRVGSELQPAIQAFTALCTRFPNLLKVEINYFDRMPDLGEQLKSEALQVLSSNCNSLEELSLIYCYFMDDAAIHFLSPCRKLKSLTLDGIPISSTEVSSGVISFKNLSSLHFIHCMKVSNTEWLELLGRSGNLRELSIKFCLGITELDIIKLGPGWKKLRKLDFAVNPYRLHSLHYNRLLLSEWEEKSVSCDELRELSLTNCIGSPGEGLSFLFRICHALEKLSLDTCVGVTHNDFVSLSQKSGNLHALTMCLRDCFPTSFPGNVHLLLRDDSLRALADGCRLLNTLDLSFCFKDSNSYSFTEEGLIAVIVSCPIQVLKLHCADFFNDICMQLLDAAQCLQVLQLLKCQFVTDEGLTCIVNLPSLKTINLYKCVRVSDIGLNQLVDTRKLDFLEVKDCPYISEAGIKGAAKSIIYK